MYQGRAKYLPPTRFHFSHVFGLDDVLWNALRESDKMYARRSKFPPHCRLHVAESYLLHVVHDEKTVDLPCRSIPPGLLALGTSTWSAPSRRCVPGLYDFVSYACYVEHL